MRATVPILILLAALVAQPGCSGASKSSTQGFADRMKAAQGIVDLNKKDEALAKIAVTQVAIPAASGLATQPAMFTPASR